MVLDSLFLCCQLFRAKSEKFFTNNENYYSTFWQNFRQINAFSTKSQCNVEKEKFILTKEIFRQINYSLVKTLLSRNFPQKCLRLRAV